MMDAGRHPNITLMAYSEVEHISGYVGNFHVTVRKKSRYVDETACTACGDCTKVCPVVRPDEFQHGFSSRKAIYIPFPQAVPSAYLINPGECLGDVPIACGKCAQVCEKGCISFDMTDQIVHLDVGAVVVATGLDVFDPAALAEYGYGVYPNVITSLEFERLISAGGPTEGHFIRPGDRRTPERIAFIQCVGSRTDVSSNGRNADGARGRPYCSNICCMNTVKDSLLLKDHYPEIDVSVFYMDIRAFGKGFETLFQRSKQEGVRYIRGLPGRIRQDAATGNLRLFVEDTTSGDLSEHEMDMVVLSLGFIPPEDQGALKHLLTLSTTEEGFFLESHPKLKPVDATTRGVYFAGCAESPKDIKDSVTQASAAAARAQTILNKERIRIEAITAVVDPELCTACERCTRVCPYNAITADAKGKIKAVVTEASCAGCGACAAECAFGAITMRHFTDQQIVAQIDTALADHPEDKLLVFACNWCSYAGADFAGVSRLQYPPHARIIRTMCSGRVDEEFVLRSFQRGAAMVLVSGCHMADCHYINANQWTQRRMDHLWTQLERKGIRPERLQLEWISAAEGQKFAHVMRELERLRQAVTLEEIELTRQALAPQAERVEEPA
jgi:heterodisulfide reductase subunit A